MDAHDEIHTICYAAGREKYQCHLHESEEHLLIYQGRQLCNDNQAPTVLVNARFINSKMFLKVLH